MVVHSVAALALATATGAQADKDTDRQTLRRFLHSSTSQMARPLVDYCLSTAPDTRAAIETGYAHYQTVMAAARDEFIASIPEEQLGPGISAADEREASVKMAEASAQLLAAVRQHDAQLYCSRIAERLRTITPEAARASIRKGQAMIEAARQRLKQ